MNLKKILQKVATMDNVGTTRLFYEESLQNVKKMQEIYLCGEDLLHEYPGKRFSIYIDDPIGWIFLNYFLVTNKVLRFIIMNQRKLSPPTPLSGTLKAVTCEDTAQIPETEIIIIATACRNQKIYNRIQTFTKAKILFLTDLIEENYIKSIFIAPIERICTSVPAKLVFCNLPDIGKIVNRSRHETMVIESGIAFGNNYNTSTHSKYTYPVFRPHGFDDNYIKDVTTLKLDRPITGQPENADGNIYLLGNSLIRGLGTDADNTIGSLLQRYINDFSKQSGRQFAVQSLSCGGPISPGGIIKKLKQLSLNETDLVVCFYYFDDVTKDYLKRNHLFCDAHPSFNRPHDMGEVFYDKYHLNFLGYNAIAKTLFSYLISDHVYNYQPKCHPQLTVSQTAGFADNSLKTLPADFDVNEELSAYQDMLRSVRKDSVVVGAIVVNCNPFTLGHRYLIEAASRQVEHLYIFVVEEDKSYLPFVDRFELVKLGTNDIENITVVPSGKFIISTLTFDAYFEKEGNIEKTIDTSLDVTVFAEKIAPILNITKRFVGEEPFCNITRQYNAEMKSILPSYGIDVVILPRKEADGGPISASRVRKLLQAGDLESVSKIVPYSTLEYLRVKCSNAA